MWFWPPQSMAQALFKLYPAQDVMHRRSFDAKTDFKILGRLTNKISASSERNTTIANEDLSVHCAQCCSASTYVDLCVSSAQRLQP